MVVIPAGSFEMGSNDDDSEKPAHSVRVKAFALAKTEVTQGQWRAVMGNNPSAFDACGDACPVENVTWNGAQEYARRLSVKTGKTYRLPSEAEWEYACRAGGRHQYCGSDDDDAVAWHGGMFLGGNSRRKTHAVAGKQANAFGLYDMSGNVEEWVADCWNENYSGAPADGSAWGSGQCSAGRVLRGGSWFFNPRFMRAARRTHFVADVPSYNFGFRPARTLP